MLLDIAGSRRLPRMGGDSLLSVPRVLIHTPSNKPPPFPCDVAMILLRPTMPSPLHLTRDPENVMTCGAGGAPAQRARPGLRC